jgi:hypothetical protein
MSKPKKTQAQRWTEAQLAGWTDDLFPLWATMEKAQGR